MYSQNKTLEESKKELWEETVKKTRRSSWRNPRKILCVNLRIREEILKGNHVGITKKPNKEFLEVSQKELLYKSQMKLLDDARRTFSIILRMNSRSKSRKNS